MGPFKRLMGVDFVDTVLHVVVTLFVAYLGTEVLSPGAHDDGAVLACVFGASAAFYGWRRQQALRRRPPESAAELDVMRMQDIEARLADLDAGQARLQELEERLDFAERMLAQQREPRFLGTREDA